MTAVMGEVDLGDEREKNEESAAINTMSLFSEGVIDNCTMRPELSWNLTVSETRSSNFKGYISWPFPFNINYY